MRLVTRLLPIALVVTMLTPTPAGAAAGFGDVPDGTWYEDAVEWLVDHEITTGVEPGCFAPQEPVSRGQIAAFLFRLDESVGGSPTGTFHPFRDVWADYQQTPVAWMYENSITVGTSDTTFSPDDPVTRGQFAVFLWRYAGRPGVSGAHGFRDVTVAWQDTAVAWMARSGITTGTTSVTFSPNDHMTRAEAAAFLWRFAGGPLSQGSVEETPCNRELRLALIDGGLTTAEAACALRYLGGYSVQQLTDVLLGTTYPSFEMISDISAAATECLTPERVTELTQLLF